MTLGKGAIARRILVAATAAGALVAPVVAAAPADAAGTVVSAVSLSAPRSAAYGTHMSLTGTVWRYGTQVKIGGAPIILQRSAHGANRWASYQTTRSAANGTFAFPVTQTLAYDFRAVYPGSAVYRPGTSAVRYPIVIQKVFLDGMATVNPDDGILRAVGRVFPTPPKGSRVYLQRYDVASKTYKSFTSTLTTGSSTVVFNARVGASTAYYRIYAPTRGAYYAGASVGKLFTHYVWRGAFKRLVSTSGDFQVSSEPDDDRGVAFATATVNGDASAVVNTAGCVRFGTVGFNFKAETARLEVRHNSTFLRYVTVPGGTETAPGQTSASEVALGGRTPIFVGLRDLGGSEPLDAAVVAFALCSN